jgi:CDP-glycerol glycerophosphotransferase
MKKIKNILKNNKILYFLYHYIISFLLKLFGLFIKTDDKLILFNSFGGAKFDDSPKAIYDYIKNNPKYDDYTLVWAIDDFSLVDGKVNTIKNNSFKYFVTALKAKYWITNSSIERGLKFKKQNTIYINTWHGSAFKLMGNDMRDKTTNYNVSKADYFYAQSMYDINVFSKAYNLSKKTLVLAGLPRNDELFNVKKAEIENIKNKLNIPLNKKVILYAPTFREYSRGSNGCVLKPPININLWEKKLSSEYIILFRAHYEVNKVLNIKDSSFIRNVTNYPTLNDLLKISDVLISDYSSIMVDYSILERPIYCYAYDYDEYNSKRGLYIDLKKELPNGICITQEELLDQIKKCEFDVQKMKTKKFKEKYVECGGNARKYVDKIILGEDLK